MPAWKNPGVTTPPIHPNPSAGPGRSGWSWPTKIIRCLSTVSYLYLTRAMDYYDAAAYGGGSLIEACSPVEARLLLIAYSSDWLYPPAATREVAAAVLANNGPASFIEIPSSYGHDAFLLEAGQTAPLIDSFLDKA